MKKKCIEVMKLHGVPDLLVKYMVARHHLNITNL